MNRQSLSILLLEDSDLDAELVQEYLRRGGLDASINRVWTRQAFANALQERSYDLILADYVLPAFDGMSALDMAHAVAPHTPFIFVSGTLGEEVAIESLKRGATDYVVKQRLARLPAAVERAFTEARERQARRTAESRLQEINASLEAAVQTRTRERDVVWRLSQDLFIICDAQGIIQSANPASMMALDASDLRGLSFADQVAPADREPARQAMARSARGEVLRDVDLRLQVGTRQRWYAWTFVPTEAGHFYAAGRDVDDRRELESRLRQVQKMESLGQLTGGVAHDFNNLLTIILGNLERVQRSKSPLTQQQRDALANAASGARRAAELTGSLLAFSRRQPLAPRRLDLNGLTRGLSELLARTLGEQITLDFTLADDAWPVEADPNQLENAIINLAVNARDAMPDGGSLRLRTQNTTLDADYCARQEGVRPGDYLMLRISDTGVGMDEATMAKVFEPFFTTKAAGHGTGLGLSQVYGFVAQSGGHVRIASALRKGTTIDLFLPRTTAAATEQALPETDPAAPPARAREGETVLVVEDNDGVREHALDALQALGYQTLAAAHAEAALALIDTPARIDLLFTDVGLPGMNGRQLAAAVRERRPALPVLYTSAYAAESLLRQGRLDADVALLAKPYEHHDLARMVRMQLDSAGSSAASAAASTAADAVVSAPPVGSISAAAAQRTAPAGARPRVLVVEDDELLRELTAEMLDGEGYDATLAATGGEALGVIGQDAAPAFSAALIDVGLPDMSGADLAAQLRSLHPALPLLMVSGAPSPALQARFDGDIRFDYLPKPYRSEHLFEALARLRARA
ncbi:hypothetical protein CEG14_21770 [Bordetella genomosp. 1]|uniref:histidine kinase n=1 Tax=Bordetella genomosp. 1 TaxID=1395607 RepID=A0A261RWH6_9BORD|nr:response regulator [Bordetella genomosp. 1]OZI29251.1 hypothetical protein CEG14_21770 [Bordetella genomosp. 1]